MNEEAAIYERIKNDGPSWWHGLITLKGVYVEIRKHNRIHIYYYCCPLKLNIHQIPIRNADKQALRIIFEKVTPLLIKQSCLKKF